MARSKPAKPDPLARALAAAEAHEHEEVLAALLAMWKDAPSAELAALVARASALVPPTATGLRGKTAAVTAAWKTLAKDPPPREIPALLEGLADATSAEGVKRLALVGTWPPDPRVEAALVGLVEHVPYRATSTQPFWRALWPLLRELREPSLVERLRAADASIEKNVAVTMGAWLRGQLAKIVEALDLPEPSSPPPEYARLAALLERGAKAHAPRDELEHLLQAIYDAPDDDAPRLVYADALLERNDPRGELIALQCRTAPLDREQKKREKALLETHGKSWLGPLAPIIMAGYRFERGFLAACRVDNEKRDHVRSVVGHPSWATVRELRGSAAIALHPVMKSLRSLRFDPMNARHAEGIDDAWQQLLTGTERPLESLYYDGLVNHREWIQEDPATRRGFWRRTLDDDELSALLRCDKLPRLRELVIAEDPALLAPRIFTAPVTKRLATLGFAFSPHGGFTTQWLVPGLTLAPVPTLTLTLRPEWHTTTVRVERGTEKYERVAIELGPTSKSNWSEALASEVIEVLRILPPTIRELRIAMRKNFEAPSRERVRAAARALPGLAVCELD